MTTPLEKLPDHANTPCDRKGGSARSTNDAGGDDFTGGGEFEDEGGGGKGGGSGPDALLFQQFQAFQRMLSAKPNQANAPTLQQQLQQMSYQPTAAPFNQDTYQSFDHYQVEMQVRQHVEKRRRRDTEEALRISRRRLDECELRSLVSRLTRHQ
jgi:hypothetical protein